MVDYQIVVERLRKSAQVLGFQQLGITNLDLGEHLEHLAHWLADGRHGEMSYMARNTKLRAKPDLLVPHTIRVLSARMNYLTDSDDPVTLLDDGKTGYVSRYALGRDYHKVVRRRLAKLAKQLQLEVPDAQTRVFADSAPVLEKAFAEKAGLGWIGKNTLLLNKQAGSWFFLGEIFTSAPLPVDTPKPENHCGSCSACLDICPTGALTGPRQLDARRCISYLTIEHKGDIPENLRSAIGNRIFGCDDCQLVCPWNRFAQPSGITDFNHRSPFAQGQLLAFWGWTESEFLGHTEGMALRRINYEQWQRNLAVALGNAPPSSIVRGALEQRIDSASPMVQRHIEWALERHSSVVSAVSSGLE